MPVRVDLTEVVDVATGYDHACAVRADGTVWCWGSNASPDLGDGTCIWDSFPVPGYARHHWPGRAEGVNGAVQVTAGVDHSCALLKDGTVMCWGTAEEGICGVEPEAAPERCPLHFYTPGDPLYPCARTPVAVAGLAGAKQIAAAYFTTCALMLDTTVKCWGDGGHGQLGIPPDPLPAYYTARAHPQTVAGLADVTQIAGNGYHFCALLADTTVKCWGDNFAGKLGFTSTEVCRQTACATAPTAIPGLSDVAEIALSAGHSCAQMLDGTVRCWGENTAGELGTGAISFTSRSKPLPMTVLSSERVANLALGWLRTCAMLDDNRVFCWGSNVFGALGIDENTERSYTPVQVQGIP